MTDSELRLEALRMALTQHCVTHEDEISVAEKYYAFLSKGPGADDGRGVHLPATGPSLKLK